MFFKTIFLSVILDVCSSSSKIDSRIYDGELVKRGQFPWHVGVGTIIPNNPIVFHGGAVISESWILTSAHFLTAKISRIVVVLGSVVHPIRDDKHRLVANVSSWVGHEKFKNEGDEFDVGLVKLAKPLVFTEFIKPIRLSSEEIPSRTSVVVSGFGENPSELSDLRFSVQVAFNCSSHFPKMICAYADPESDTQNACRGDEGGALVTNNFLDAVHVGVVTSSKRCGWFGYNVYASTAFNRDWIKKVSGV